MAGAACAAAIDSAEPSFDCTLAKSSAEKAVCLNANLAGLDRETARLYKLAVNTPGFDTGRLNQLKAYQRGWIKGRDECWKASIGLEKCVAESYVTRIHELRRGYANARSDDDAGVSSGPVAYRCDGLDALVSAVFIKTKTPLVSLTWRDTWLALPLAPAGSGTLYSADYYAAGTFTFRTRGDEATLEKPGEEALHCTEEPTG